MTDLKPLEQKIDAAFQEFKHKSETFKQEETQKHKEWQQRLAQLEKAFESLSQVWRPRLDVLVKKFGDKVKATPTLTPSTRNAVFDFQSDVARIRLKMQATTDHDIRKVILNYDLEVTPILMQFDSHSELEMPLDQIDPAKVGAWIDGRILSFVKTYISLHENEFYLRDQMVQDPVTGTRFPKLAAGAKIERGGQTHYFISDETCREFEKKPVAAK